MKFVCQLDYPHWRYITRTGFEGAELIKGKTTTIATSGCGLCCAIMMADRLIPNCDFDLTAAIDLSYETNANHIRGTDFKIFAPALAQRLGLRYETAYDITDVHRCLKSGGAVVAHVHGAKNGREGVFSHGGHYIFVVGYEADGRLVILDPAYRPGRYDIPERKEKTEVKYDLLVLADAQTLDEAKAMKSPPYHLFWRK